MPLAYFQNQSEITQALRACENLQQLYFHREEPVKTNHGVFDVSTSLIFLLSLADSAGVHFRLISSRRDHVCLTSCAGLAEYPSVLRNMDQLDLDFELGFSGLERTSQSHVDLPKL